MNQGANQMGMQAFQPLQQGLNQQWAFQNADLGAVNQSAALGLGLSATNQQARALMVQMKQRIWTPFGKRTNDQVKGFKRRLSR